jgi:hypothetical protein
MLYSTSDFGLKILNLGLCRFLQYCLFGHGVGWFELFSKQAMSEHRPINQHQ